MRFLRTNTAIRITVGPFLDKTDGVTPETGLTATNEHLTLMVDDGNVPTLVLDADATASGGNNDFVHVTNDDAGFYDLELTAANLNYLGRAMLAITYATDHCPVFHEFMILPAVVYDSIVLGTDVFQVDLTQIGGSAVSTSSAQLGVNIVNLGGSAVDQASGLINANVKQISTDATAADNAEAFFDGTGYAGTNNVIPTVTTATNVTTVNGLADNVVTAASIATDAIGAAELAADAITEIVAGVWGAARSSYVADGTMGQSMILLDSGTAQAGAGTTITLAAGASSTNDYYDGAIVQIVGGTGAGQSRIVKQYVGTSRLATVSDGWGTTPDNTSVYIVRALGDVEVGVNNDKTGYSLTATTGLGNQTADITGSLSGSVGSVAAGGITAASIATDAIDADALAADAVTEIQSGLATSAEIGALNDFDPAVDVVAHVTLVDTTTTNTDMRGTDNASQDSDMAVVLTQVNQLTFDSDSQVYANAAVSLTSDDIDQIADAVIAGASDPWTTALPGAYSAGQAGYIVGTNLDEAISIKAYDSDIQDLLTGVIVTTNNDKTGYSLTSAYDSAKTAAQDSDVIDLLTYAVLASYDSDGYILSHPQAFDSDEGAGIALEFLKYDWTGITGEASRSVLNALRFIRNKFSTTASVGNVTIYKEDDTSVAYTKAITTDSDANPIVVG